MRSKLILVVAPLVVAALAAGGYFGVGALTDEDASAQEGGGGSTIRVKVNRVYSVKYLCGSQNNGSIGLADDYETKINIHNSDDAPITFAKKVVSLTPGQEPLPPTDLFAETLEPNWGLEMDCEDILNLYKNGLGGAGTAGGTAPFGEGFVVFETDRYLDIWAVYTATKSNDLMTVGEGEGEVAGDSPVAAGLSMDVVRVNATDVKNDDVDARLPIAD